MSIDPGTPAGAGGAVPPTPASERLQSMLAQAVEGQQNEQRELSNALNDMRNQLLRLGQEIAELRAVRVDASTDPAIINNVTVELRESVRFLSERLDGVTRMVAQRGEDLADIRGALNAVDAQVRSQTETLGVLSQGLQALPSYGERVSALHEAVDAVHSRLAALDSSVAKAGEDSALQRLAAEQRAALRQLHEKLGVIADGTQAALAVPPVFDDSLIQGLDARLAALAVDVAALAARNDAPPSLPDAVQHAVAEAVQESEERLRSHIDDAVLALAEILVRRRPPATADQITGTPLSTAANVPPPPAGVAALGVPADHVEDADTAMVDFSVAEFGDEDDAANDEYDDEYDEADEDSAGDDVDDAEDGEDGYEEDEDGDDYVADEDPDATGELRIPSVFADLSALDPPVVEPPPPPPAHMPWAPEIPPERAEPEPSDEASAPDERKRRWFSR